MGGQGSGRKPDPVKHLLGFGQPAKTDGAEVYIPDYSGVAQHTRTLAKLDERYAGAGAAGPPGENWWTSGANVIWPTGNESVSGANIYTPGQVSGAQLNATGNISGAFIHGDGSLLINLPSAGAGENWWTSGANYIWPTGDETISGAALLIKGNISGASYTGLTLEQIENPTAAKSFNMTDNQLRFLFVNPTTGEGAFEIQSSGNYSGHLFHVHQSGGNPTGVELVHLEAGDVDVIPLAISGAAYIGIVSDKAIISYTDISGASISGANVTEGADPGHTHTAYAPDAEFNDLSGAYVDLSGAHAGTVADLADLSGAHAQLSGAAYTHIDDNTQAHSDYLLNSTNDTTTKALTMSGAYITGDQATADAAYVPMVLYNTDDTPPAASGFPIGTLYVQYTA